MNPYVCAECQFGVKSGSDLSISGPFRFTPKADFVDGVVPAGLHHAVACHNGRGSQDRSHWATASLVVNSKLRGGTHLISANRYKDEQRRNGCQESNVPNVKLYQSADDGARRKGHKRKPNAMSSACEH